MSDLPHLCSICINAQSEVVNNRTVTIGSIIAWCYDCNRCVMLSGERQSIRAAIDALDEHGAGDTHTPHGGLRLQGAAALGAAAHDGRLLERGGPRAHAATAEIVRTNRC